jgi:xylan 1,4-beta-xylosidase
MSTIIENPILSGSHPDPDIIRVGEDFYLATTTFEWLPGVRIHHSRDLVNWTLVVAPLDGQRVGNLRAVPDSGGELHYIAELA